ncbi:unnamed protein product [Arctogadus glacialis]
MHSTEKSSWIPPESTGSKQHSHRPAMMSGAPGPRRALPPDQSRSGGSSHTLTPSRQPSHNLDPLPSKRICFYKSGDPQFGGLRMVINRRTFKSFEALLDGLSTKVPLPFGVRNITTPRGLHAVHTLDQLEDGGSYICSDSRKVKPINLALARKKLPPWYNARPGTGRRRAVQVGRMYPGAGKQRRGAGPVVMVHTPRRLTVFRNGEPAGSQTVTLKKRSTQSFEVVLQALSELMQFPVVKLHATDGRRVDGLQALILCSGTVVAAGKEPFKPGNYDVHRSPAPKRPPGTRPGSRKIRPSKRRSRNYSESSQRYFLNQLHNSLSESVFDSNPTDSIELENSHLLESVVEMDAEPCSDHGTHEQGSCLPTEDDIEKSFRVNEDGSMTVEMKVRLTLKEEETIHWTTTLTRSSVANEPLPDCFPDPEPEQESGSPEHDRPEPSEPALPLETTSSRKPRGDNDDNDQPPPHESGVSGEAGNMEDDVTGKTNHVKSTWRAPTPGFRKAKTSSESVSANMAEPVQEGTVRSYSYRAETEQYRMVQQSSTRPVPKPRRLASMDVNYGYGQAEFNSVGMSEVLQIENNGEEVTETMLHVYEQQTCQENYYANTNYRAQGVSVYGNNYGRPSTSDTTWSMNANVEPQFGRPSTASESIPSMRAAISNPCKSLVLNTPQKEFTANKDYYKLLRESGKGKKHQNVADKANKKSSNTKAVKKHVRWIKSPGNRRKQSLTEASKKRTKVKTFSSTGFLKKIYGGRPVKTTMRRKKTATENEKVRLATESSDPPDVTMKCTIKDQYTLSSGDDKMQETIPFESNMLKLSSKTRATQQLLTNQRSIHEERQTHKASSEVNRTLPLPVFNSSSSVNNEYVKHWLENSPSQHALCPGDRTQADKMTCQVGLDDRRSEPTNPAPEEPEIPQRNVEPDLLDKIEPGISASILNTGLNESKRETLELTNQPNLEPVLEKIVSSIKSIRQRTQKKKPYCLEKSNSLPDFSGHVTTTFGSSSKALLAFLAVMTLKEVLAQEPKCEMDELNPSRAEALKLIDSLREIASIEDSDQLKNSLSELQMSASTQLLQSWKGFQELSKSRRLPNQSEEGLRSGRRCVDYSGAEEGAIDELMEELDIPKTLKEALAAFPACTPTERDDSVSVEANTPEKPSNDNVTTNSEGNTVNGSDYVQTTKANADREALVDVKAIVKRFTDPGKPQASNEKPANLKQPNLSDDQKVVHTQQITHNGEDSTTDFKDIALLQEEQHPTSAPHVSIEDNQEEDSRNNDKQEEELEQDSLNENQSIKLYVPYMDLEEATERNEESRCSSESEHLDRELKEIDRNSEDSMFSPEEMFSPEVESSSDEEQKHMLSTEGRHGNIFNPKTQQKLPSPQEPQDVVLRQLKQVRNNPMSDYKSLSSSEEEEQKLQRTNRFKRLGVNIISTHETSRQDVEDQTSSEDDQHVEVQQLGRTHTKPVHVFPHIDKQIRRKLTKIESLSERSEESVSTPDAEELGKLEKVQPQVQKLEPQEQLSCTEAMTKPVCKAVNQEQRVHGKLSAEDTSCQRAPPQKKAQPAEIISQSVAERICLLKQQVAETQWKSKTAGVASIRIPADEAPLKVESSTPDTKTTQPLPGFRSAPHSSLSFSYESNCVINRQPEGANVRSIKDMFMAKSLPDVQREEADVHGPIHSEASPASQSQDPFELSEAASIAKGFVRRTIERLYGRKDPNAADTPSKRSTSSPKPKIESFSIFSSLPSARSKQRSDMPYFNSTNTLDTLGGVTRCMAFNTQVVPDNSLPMNQDRTLHHKTYSDQVEINKAAETPLPDGDLPDDGKQTVPVSPISRNPEPVDKLALTRCTYFSLPCTSDSEPGPEDPGAMSMNAESIVDIKEDQEEAKGLVADHGPLPGLRLHDNKVHPLTQGAPGGTVVVVQPVRAQRVAPRPVELDALDALYTFCGQHCPIL